MSHRAVLILLSVCPLAGQVLTTATLFERGLAAYERKEYEPAARFLYAYEQRNPAAMQNDPAHAAQVRTAVQFSLDRVADMRNRLQRLEETAANSEGGVGSKVSGLGISPPALKPPGRTGTGYFPLVCRGGGNMRFSWLPGAFNIPGPLFIIDFEKAPRGASADPGVPGPGQCAWRDRAIAPDEPSNICAIIEPSRFGIAWGAPGAMPAIISAAPAFVHALSRGDSPVYFEVRNNGSGCFLALQ